jgi:tRNA uridine 5-carboxymethylaminomethyl modification enzyme
MDKYQDVMTKTLLSTPSLSLRQDDVVGIAVTDDGAVAGVETRHSGLLRARRVIITTGTFMAGKLHLGQHTKDGGRAGEAPTIGLSASLARLGLELGRLKTGTCPRLDGRTIEWDSLEEQRPDLPPPQFSLFGPPPPLKQVSCFITYTNRAAHEVIYEAIRDGTAPMYNGQIEGRGPRYCPSIEDKVTRFAEKEAHLIFLEPHGLDTYEIYPNGLSTSLPPAVQERFLRSIRGLEKVAVTRWGYAVEYDYVKPTQLKHTLETKTIPGLYCAGQINGTTGYEEAAAQGLLAGINAACSLAGRAPVTLPRHVAYLGVLVDDLVTLGTEEPYRMFTSRAEHRLLLREDNVYARLMDVGASCGLLDAKRYDPMKQFEQKVADEMGRLTTVRVPANPEVNAVLASLQSAPLCEPASLAELLKRPEITAEHIDLIENKGCGDSTCSTRDGEIPDINRDEWLLNNVRKRAAIEIKYEGYVTRSQRAIEREQDLLNTAIPPHIFESRLPGLSHEVFEKLKRIRPQTLAQASRISGVTPAAVSLLLAAASAAKIVLANSEPDTCARDEGGTC